MANQGERIGQLQNIIKEIDHDHELKMGALENKQMKLFNSKNVLKWENPDAARLPKAD